MTVYNLPNNSAVAVADIFDPLPEFMREADTLFIDPPYNQSLLSNFSNREDVLLSKQNPLKFARFTERLFECAAEIAPKFLFIEMGKEHLSSYIELCKLRYKYVTFYNSTYYQKQENKCYIIHATNDQKRRRYDQLEDLDEKHIISWICANHQYQCIGDLCMGTGLVGRYAYLNGCRFVGTELNPKRLALLVDFITQEEAKHAPAQSR